MTQHSTSIELQNMQAEDLRREIKAQDLVVEKMRMGIRVQKEKDTAKYRREKRTLARMKTILAQTLAKELKPKKKTSTISAPHS